MKVFASAVTGMAEVKEKSVACQSPRVKTFMPATEPHETPEGSLKGSLKGFRRVLGGSCRDPWKTPNAFKNPGKTLQGKVSKSMMR